MSWMNQLYQTYRRAEQITDLADEEKLPPIGHTSQNAHIHVTIDGNGNFLRAEVWKKTAIILPATEESENRTSGEAPHPLADKIQYVAQDYPNYGGQKKAYFSGYQKQLQAWVESPFSHPSTRAILKYVEKGHVIADLIAAKIVFIDDQQKFISKWPEQSTPVPDIYGVLPKDKGSIEVGSALIAWSVEIPEYPEARTWMDTSLHHSWMQYQLSQGAEEGFCFVTGTHQPISRLHPAKIRHTGDKAKLISANDEQGLTFKGRFTDSLQSTSVSAEVSQKAHAALRWLIGARKQAQRNGDQVTVAWALSTTPIPNPIEDPITQLNDEFDLDDFDEDTSGTDSPLMTQAQGHEHHRDLGQQAAHKLRKKLAGYQAKLDHHDQLTVLSLDSATTGRMAITYYQQFMPHEYFAALQQWQDDFQWYQRHSKDLPAEGKKKARTITIFPMVAPAPYAIAQAAYGRALSDELKKQVIARILPNIVEPNRPFPFDLMQRCVAAACNRQGFESWEWERNLGVACALYRGYYTRHPDPNKRRSFIVALDESNHSRDYLYGRLLAVAERMERVALDVAGEGRATTAERYFQQFADRPFTTWRNISTALRPYQERLRNRRPAFLNLREKELSEITNTFQREDFMNDSRLSGEFLLGYHSQKMSYRTDKSDTNTTQDSAE